ncbi:MAG: SpoIIE family protein phosphatase [Candidatus Woesearchaeota archaeon]
MNDNNPINSDERAELIRLTKFEMEIRESYGNIRFSQNHVPNWPGFSMSGATRQLNHIFGGDHIACVDYKNRVRLDDLIIEASKLGRMDSNGNSVADELPNNEHRSLVVVADVAGHDPSTVLETFAFHHLLIQAVRNGLIYEGQFSIRNIRSINNRIRDARSLKQVASTFGEIYDDGKFRCANFRAPYPIRGRLDDKKAYFERPNTRVVANQETALGLAPDLLNPMEESKFAQLKIEGRVTQYDHLRPGEFLILYTDGWLDRESARPGKIRRAARDVMHHHRNEQAEDLTRMLIDASVHTSPPDDDMSVFLIKRT